MRLNRISIKNYKGIDSLKFEFPKPKFFDETDILMICGENGSGKSSILECAALILMAKRLEDLNSAVFFDQLPERNNAMPDRLFDLLVRYGTDHAEIVGELEDCGNTTVVRIIIDEEGIFLNEKMSKNEFEFNPSLSDRYDIFCNIIYDILGYKKEPIIFDKLLYFNSYRNYRFNSPILHEASNRRVTDGIWARQPLNLFKRTILDLMMAGANILEFDIISTHNKNNDGKTPLDPNIKILEFLNEIIKKYADGKFGKIRALPDSTYDFRVQINDELFSMDSLGSGHKEIIATLFFIRYFTKDESKVIFIDEPELHFNAEWHREFMSDISVNPMSEKLKNQFIMATHSEDIFKSVRECNRFLLVK